LERDEKNKKSREYALGNVKEILRGKDAHSANS